METVARKSIMLIRSEIVEVMHYVEELAALRLTQEPRKGYITFV